MGTLTANRLEILFDLLLEGKASGNGLPVSAGEAAARLSASLDELFPDTDFHERIAERAFDEALTTRTMAAPADLVQRAVASLPSPGGGLVERLSRFLRSAPSVGGWQAAGGLAAASIAFVAVFVPVERSSAPDMLAPSAPVVHMPQPGKVYEPGGWGHGGETSDFSTMSGGSAGTFVLHDETGCDAGAGHSGMSRGGGGQTNEARPFISGTNDGDVGPCDPETRLSSPEDTFTPFAASPADSMPEVAPY